MAEEQDSEKTEEPTQHRIDEFRKRGEVASSRELTSVLLLLASVGTLALSIVFIYETLSNYIEWLYSLSVESAYYGKAQQTILTNTIVVLLKCIAPIFISSVCIGIMAHIIQFGFLYAPEVLQLKFDRVNPINGFQKLFTIRSLVEAFKAVMKFVVVMTIIYWFMADKINLYNGFLQVDYFQSFLYGKELLVELTFSILLGLGVIALGDFAYQKFSYAKKIRMTKDEAKREHKEQEGSPELKQRIRAVQREMSQKRMMQDVPKADVIVTNPTHLSIAIKYDAETMVSPEVIAKGADHMAMKIREIAKEHNIPIVENVPLARTMYKTVKTGAQVPRSLYKAVAEVLAFVYKLKRKQKALR